VIGKTSIGKEMSAYKTAYVNGELPVDSPEFADWKAQMLAKCPWASQMEKKYQAGEIEQPFPFISLRTSGSGAIFSKEVDMNNSPSGFEIEYVPYMPRSFLCHAPSDLSNVRRGP
jgi:hypothetical protein